jgi:hypothetical protein
MAEKKFFVDINLQGSALTNATIGTNSSLTKAGSFGFDGTRLQYFDGGNVREVANLSDISAVTGGLIFQGGYDASTNTPDIADGNALKGFFWAVTVAGTFLGEAVQVGDSIVAKVDEAGATLSDWLILQGNVVIATDEVDGIVRLANQGEANDGTESGAVVITPATLQGKIDAQIAPAISSKLSKNGGTMSGAINMGNNNIDNVDGVNANGINTNALSSPGSEITFYVPLTSTNGATITNLPAPTNDGDATNKLYVDNASNDKLPLAGGTMTGNIDMGGNGISSANSVSTLSITTGELTSPNSNGILVSRDLSLDGNSIKNLAEPLANNDAARKGYVDATAATAQANAIATASADATAKADAAQAAAEAYADSLAPNYDPAGSASTAESNANDYTDNAISTEVTDRNNAIAALSYFATIATEDWTLNGDTYEFTLTHNLGSTFPVITFFDGGNIQCELISVPYGPTAMLVKSNILPSGNIFASLVRGAV